MVYAHRHYNLNGGSCHSDKVEAIRAVASKLVVLIARQGHVYVHMGVKGASWLQQTTNFPKSITAGLSRLQRGYSHSPNTPCCCVYMGAWSLWLTPSRTNCEGGFFCIGPSPCGSLAWQGLYNQGRLYRQCNEAMAGWLTLARQHSS